MVSRSLLLPGRHAVQRTDCHEITYEGGHSTVTTLEGAEVTLGGTGPPSPAFLEEGRRREGKRDMNTEDRG